MRIPEVIMMLHAVVFATLLTSTLAQIAEYVKMPFDTNGCDTGSVAVMGEVSCRAAAASLGVQFGYSGSNGGAPEGCYYLAGDDGRVTEVSWNNLGEKTWHDVASVCQEDGTTPASYSKMQFDRNGCDADPRHWWVPIFGEVSCTAAAASLGVKFGGSGKDSGAHCGCFYLAGDDGRDAKVSWNTRCEITWHDVASVCQMRTTTTTILN